PGETTKLDVGLNISKPGTLSGRITEAGKLFCKGIRKAEIVATNNDTLDSYTTKSKLFGRYTLKDLPPGEYTIVVTAEGYQDAVDYVTIEASGKHKLNFELQPLEE
ncbi:MAG TPA: carboxypeptidase regulatory-like domain-containing protein, partial [Thermoplasmatales archaeon]|nr:carboxypeptidase regulatory-like domain-containing protein [Thermoplasmatales archaeon]